MDKLIPNFQPPNAMDLLRTVPIVQGAIAGQQSINEEIKKAQEEAKVQGEEVFGRLYNRSIPQTIPEDIEENNDSAEEDQPLLMKNEDDKFPEIDDEQPPEPIASIPQPQVQPIIPEQGGNPPMLGIGRIIEPNQPPIQPPIPQQQIDYINYIDYIDNEAIDIADRAHMNPLHRTDFIEYVKKLLLYAGQIGITWTNTETAIKYINDKYYRYKESILPPTPPTETGNFERQDFFEKNGVPPQCQRRVYFDQQGVLRSIVICTGLGESDRIYHDH